MLTTTCPNVRKALEIVTNPAQFADLPAPRAQAWAILKEERGQRMCFDTLPEVIHAQPVHSVTARIRARISEIQASRKKGGAA